MVVSSIVERAIKLYRIWPVTTKLVHFFHQVITGYSRDLCSEAAVIAAKATLDKVFDRPSLAKVGLV